MLNNTVKLYGETKRVWEYTDEKGKKHVTQVEIAYKEFYLDGTLKYKGSEDFSAERYSKELIDKEIRTWDGQKRNKGDKRWFEFAGWIKYSRRHSKEVMELLKSRYPQAVAIELR